MQNPSEELMRRFGLQAVVHIIILITSRANSMVHALLVMRYLQLLVLKK